MRLNSVIEDMTPRLFFAVGITSSTDWQYKEVVDTPFINPVTHENLLQWFSGQDIEANWDLQLMHGTEDALSYVLNEDLPDYHSLQFYSVPLTALDNMSSFHTHIKDHGVISNTEEDVKAFIKDNAKWVLSDYSVS